MTIDLEDFLEEVDTNLLITELQRRGFTVTDSLEFDEKFFTELNHD